MKNVSFALIAITMLAILAPGCTEETNTVTEKPFQALFADNVLSNPAETDTFIDDGYYEFGFEFTVTKNGRVTELGIHNPDAGNVRATLWDMSDTSVLVSRFISVSAHTPKYETIGSPVSLTTGKKYALTMLSDDYYYLEAPGAADYPYPITKGNVQITKYGYRNATNTDPAIYPTSFYEDYLAGIVDITFETEE